MRKLRKLFRKGGICRFFINTLFDSTFMLLGIAVGSAVAGEARLQSVISTMVAGSLALGISTGVSVYDAKSLEQERIAKLKKAIFEDLMGRLIHKSARSITLAASLIISPPALCHVQQSSAPSY
jgi:hypothetical protein